MEENLRKFLKEKNIPETVQNLLELYGINALDDLKIFDEETIAEVELAVRENEFSSRVDFSSKQMRIKYLGFDATVPEVFKFRPMEKKKLLNLQAAAKIQLEKKTSKKR